MATFYRVNFQAANNEDIRQAFALTDSNGAVVDLTGGTLEILFDRLVGTDTSQFAASTLNGRINFVDAALGQFELVIPKAIMRTIPAGVYHHDLLLTLAGRVRRIWEGTLTLDTGVTQ
jgi:hypothetical protein